MLFWVQIILMLKIAHVLYAGLGGVSDVCSVLGKIDNKIQSKSFFIQVGPKKFVKKISNWKSFHDFIFGQILVCDSKIAKYFTNGILLSELLSEKEILETINKIKYE